MGLTDPFQIMFPMIVNHICSYNIDIPTKYEVFTCLKWLWRYIFVLYITRDWLWHKITQQGLLCHKINLSIKQLYENMFMAQPEEMRFAK